MLAIHYARNLDKSGANHESCVVYTPVIRVRFLPDLLRQFSTTSGFCMNHQRAQTSSHVFISIHGSCVLEDLFWKFLNSSRLINYQLNDLWLFVMLRRWVRES